MSPPPAAGRRPPLLVAGGGLPPAAALLMAMQAAAAAAVGWSRATSPAELWQPARPAASRREDRTTAERGAEASVPPHQGLRTCDTCSHRILGGLQDILGTRGTLPVLWRHPGLRQPGRGLRQGLLSSRTDPDGPTEGWNGPGQTRGRRTVTERGSISRNQRCHTASNPEAARPRPGPLCAQRLWKSMLPNSAKQCARPESESASMVH